MSGPRRITAIEVMVVAAILGILAAIMIPAFIKASRRQTQRQAAAPQDTGIEPAGQFNTIEMPDAPSAGKQRSQPAPASAPDRPAKRGGGSGFITVMIVLMLISFLRQKFQRARRPPSDE